MILDDDVERGRIATNTESGPNGCFVEKGGTLKKVVVMVMKSNFEPKPVSTP